jgi:hypothetical protein
VCVVVVVISSSGVCWSCLFSFFLFTYGSTDDSNSNVNVISKVLFYTVNSFVKIVLHAVTKNNTLPK